NRFGITLACLDSLFAQNNLDSIKLSVFLVDDNSADGTADAVHERYPQVHIIMGDGNLFWNRGMHRSFEEALKTGFDFYLWLNDDTTLHSEALEVLLKTHQELVEDGIPASIVIASTKDPVTGEFTYGGYRQSSNFNPLSLRLTPAADKPIYCDTFCGNVVLIPRRVAGVVGNIDPVFKHRWGDVDYGLRAKSIGCQCWIVPGYHAECAANPNADRWRDKKLPIKDKLKDIRSIKGLAKNDWKIYVRRHGGLLWPLMWVRPYMRLLYDIINPF
ncbi:MAG: glycosyltransferase family 2 protein, partial [Thiotrichaceae bacterium]|nr:glycosyltransferase family 2 protein [Thiotrichaceae bacterium]